MDNLYIISLHLLKISIQIQSLPTSGATSVEHFLYDGYHFLFVTNSLDDRSRSDISSHLYQWDSNLLHFTSAPKQLIPTLYAKSVTSIFVDGLMFLVVANYRDMSTGSYEIRLVTLKILNFLFLFRKLILMLSYYGLSGTLCF